MKKWISMAIEYLNIFTPKTIANTEPHEIGKQSLPYWKQRNGRATDSYQFRGKNHSVNAISR